ncbi:MAG: FAD-dependent oxidoreductase, partial [Halobacteriales archaeon]|nr:FAD-dependent oxidoreductase [Halobacteriales archaeon]
VYRRGWLEFTASPEQVVHALYDTFEVAVVAYPTRILTDAHGKATAVECIQMDLGPPDRSGRRSPEPIPDSEFLLGADQVILAVGQNPSLIAGAVKGQVQLSKWGDVVVDADCRTSHPKVFAAGDIALGPSSIIESIGQARKAALVMHTALGV